MTNTNQGYCEVQKVCQGSCRRKARVLVKMGLVSGPLPVCNKHADFIIAAIPSAREVEVVKS